MQDAAVYEHRLPGAQFIFAYIELHSDDAFRDEDELQFIVPVTVE